MGYAFNPFSGTFDNTGPKTNPGGSDTQVQFNDSGAFGGDSGLTYNKTTDTLSVTNLSLTNFTQLDTRYVNVSGDTMTGALFIDGSANEIQQRIQAHSTQTANILTIENSTGAVKAGFDSRGLVFSNAGVASNFLAGGGGNLTGTGIQNTFIGNEAGRIFSSGSYNVGLGSGALWQLTTGSSNFAMGREVLLGISTQSSNVGIGQSCFRNGSAVEKCVGIGDQVGQSINAYESVFIGWQAGGGYTATPRSNVQQNIGIGVQVFYNLISGGSGNVGVGYQAGLNLSSGAKNIFLGMYSGYRQTTNSNLLIVDNLQRADAATEQTNALLYGVMASTPASQSLRVNGALDSRTSAVFNEDGADYDFRVEGDTDANLFFVDASADTVQIGAATASDSAKFYVSGKLSTSGEVEINGDLNHDGSNIGFFGVTPTTRATELTDELTTITHSSPGTPDYSIQDPVAAVGYGFVSLDEALSVLSVIANLQTRVNELETKLTAYGLLQDAD